MSIDLTAIRTDYALAGLTEADAEPNPLDHAGRWLREAIEHKHPDPTAMSVATLANGWPATRTVLLKGIDEGLVFFTNYDSAKGRALVETPRASACLFWVMLERQVRATGLVTKTTREDSEAYFATRSRKSQLGAWASHQSEVIANRAVLEAQLDEVTARFAGGAVPCPPNWGGYRLVPHEVELWQGRPSRLHDRLRYTRIAPDAREWRMERLSP